jgi:hypothetical protein
MSKSLTRTAKKWSVPVRISRNTYWRRRKPPRAFDIALLRPVSFLKGERFETAEDTVLESTRSELLLKNAGAPRHLWEYLTECRAGDYVCEQTFCPSCARKFRRWFIGEILQIAHAKPKPGHIVTVLLAQATNIRELDPESFRHSLRKRLDRAGLGETVVIGGFEVVWRAGDKTWVLHVNLLILDAQNAAIARFEDSFSSSAFARPTQTLLANDLPEQISYLLKFTTYHRPYRQTGPRRSPAKPLNAKEHVALVNWMWDHSFGDMVFLYRVRRRGTRLVTAAPRARG